MERKIDALDQQYKNEILDLQSDLNQKVEQLIGAKEEYEGSKVQHEIRVEELTIELNAKTQELLLITDELSTVRKDSACKSEELEELRATGESLQSSLATSLTTSNHRKQQIEQSQQTIAELEEKLEKAAAAYSSQVEQLAEASSSTASGLSELSSAQGRIEAEREENERRLTAMADDYERKLSDLSAVRDSLRAVEADNESDRAHRERELSDLKAERDETLAALTATYEGKILGLRTEHTLRLEAFEEEVVRCRVEREQMRKRVRISAVRWSLFLCFFMSLYSLF